MAKEISAGLVIYRKTPEGNKFLLLYYGKNHWTFPRGKIESGEKSFQTAIREVKEETGISRNDLRFTQAFKTAERFTFWRNEERVYKTVIFYLAQSLTRNVRIGEYHDGYGWFTFREALRILSKHKGSQRVLNQAYNFLRKPDKSQPK